jgi:hypothetical protein
MQFPSSFIKSNFGSGDQNSSQNPWAKSKLLETGMGQIRNQIRNWPTGFDF